MYRIHTYRPTIHRISDSDVQPCHEKLCKVTNYLPNIQTFLPFFINILNPHTTPHFYSGQEKKEFIQIYVDMFCQLRHILYLCSWKMRILQVITSFLPGGAEKLVADLVPCFRHEGYEVEIAVFNALDTNIMREVERNEFIVHKFSEKGCNVYSLSNLVKLQRLLSSRSYDILHTHNTACQIFGALCRTPRNTKKVTTEHISTNRRRNIRMMKHLDRLMYSAYDKVVCVSEPTLSALKEFLGTEIADKCQVVENGINLNRYRGRIGKIDPGKDVIVTMVASFRMQKDQDTAIKALAVLPQNFRLRLIGEGERISEVRRLAADLGLTSRVEFMGFRDDIPQLLAESDIMLLSSHYEGLSLSNIEGMVSGRPFVASDVAGIREISQGAALLFHEGDFQGLARILMNLYNDQELYTQTASRCMTRGLEYDINRTAEKYLQIYRQLLSGERFSTT